MASFEVLLVDDEEDLLALLSLRLQSRGLEVSTAQSGTAALRALSEHPVDVVVLDIRMPGMDGLETLAYIKRQHPEIEVIMLTGFAETETASQALAAGAFDYLVKPVDLDELLDKLQQAHARSPRTPGTRP